MYRAKPTTEATRRCSRGDCAAFRWSLSQARSKVCSGLFHAQPRRQPWGTCPLQKQQHACVALHSACKQRKARETKASHSWHAVSAVMAIVTSPRAPRQGHQSNSVTWQPVARLLCGSPHFTADSAADGFRKSFLAPPMASKAFLGAGPPGIGPPGIMFFGLLTLGKAGVCSMPGW